MAVTLTEAAAAHVQKFLTRRGKGVGLRLGVKTSGCSGMAYKLVFADVINEDDQVWESFGVKVIVDEKSLPYLDGTELDYTREGLQEGIRFHNPNEASRCGCVESFHVSRTPPRGTCKGPFLLEEKLWLLNSVPFSFSV